MAGRMMYHLKAETEICGKGVGVIAKKEVNQERKKKRLKEFRGGEWFC